jgi:NTP pyrophosphatase (non-canonical NTP hydrolase)
MNEEKIEEMIMVMSHKHFADDETREEFENEMWEFTTRLMKMWSDFKEAKIYHPEEVRHG